jgi:hypothetical protein
MKLIDFSLFLAGLAEDANAAGKHHNLRPLVGHIVNLDRNAIRCAEDSPCAECQGDCQKDSDCMGDLVCYQKRGRAKTEEEATIPGAFATLPCSFTHFCLRK